MNRKHALSICAVFRNEGPYLREWIEFHCLVGVDHFYLYNNCSTDNYLSIVAPYVAKGIVTLYDFDVRPVQIPAYRHCIRRHRKDSEWIAFIDLDEFLFAPDGVALPERLREYDQFGGVCVNWVAYGSSGHERRPEGLVIENFVKRGSFDVEIPRPSKSAAGNTLAAYHPNKIVKTIVRMDKVSRPRRNPHAFQFRKSAYAVDTDGERVGFMFTDFPKVDKLRLNHYWCKSEDEYRAKVGRGRGMSKKSLRSLEAFSSDNPYLNTETDTCILQYLPALKERIKVAEDEAIAAKSVAKRKVTRTTCWYYLRKMLRLPVPFEVMPHRPRLMTSGIHLPVGPIAR